MSVEYTVVCRNQLPARAGGWNLAIGPVVISETLRPPEQRDADELAKSALNLTATGHNSALAFQLACEVASAYRGYVVSDEGDELRADFLHESPAQLDADGLVTRLKRLVEDEMADTEAHRQAAAQQWHHQLAIDASLQRDNDWSDIA